MILITVIVWLLCAVCRSWADPGDLKQVVLALHPLLSKDAVITFPWDARWDDLQVRGSSPRISPNYNVVVEVATEADVQTIVSLANRFNVPFLAISGGHGWTTTLNELPHGIQINMRKLNTTTLSQDGNTAIVGGGTKQYEITRSLFALGKYAVTGLSNCVSVAGPLLGGGHSLLQGQYGYSVDGLVSARVVLASSEVVEASRTQNADLFWALQGAGHNFGILTSLEVKTYDIPSDWTVYTLIFSSEKVEALFSLINDFEDPTMERPAKLALTGVFIRLPAVDPINPVVLYTVAYEGSQAQAEPYAARFIALGPIFTKVDTVNYVELYTVTGNNLTSQACTQNENVLGAGVSLPAWDIQGVRKAFTIFGEYTADPRFNTSITLMENYGMQGVRAIDAESTALAPEERELPILASAVIWWAGEDEETTKVAESHVHAMRDALYTGVDEDSSKKRHCYVNYASGDESKPEVYGYSARLERLAKLKSEWDPENRFKYYNPIV